MAWIIAAAILLVLIMIFVGGYNSFVKMKNKVEEAFGAMDIYLKKRYDLIPNFVETVKGYAKHESETLEKVIAARNMAAGSKTMDEQIENENMLQGTLKTLFSVTEAYPDLKANQNFLDLQNKLSELETEIERSRRFYNAIVAQFNTKCEMFPSNIIAMIFGFKRKPLYEIKDEAQRETVKVQF